eukprot:CAMPEP_0196781216 /NCGR_PEP_ID=MMETSP1104-20130614/9276_1 /TAXON_ID=33652 /ORGANISM="Cafeteria sp., Strain Caron Lab Isolate" /LENGTH=571 /DNA_ID=CAMNT_0042151437 /DNA_START=39 /DNA_END=1754 /DNA_ORIENTATION=+
MRRTRIPPFAFIAGGILVVVLLLGAMSASPAASYTRGGTDRDSVLGDRDDARSARGADGGGDQAPSVDATSRTLRYDGAGGAGAGGAGAAAPSAISSATSFVQTLLHFGGGDASAQAPPGPARPEGCISADEFFPNTKYVSKEWFDAQVMQSIPHRKTGATWVGVQGRGLMDYLDTKGWTPAKHPSDASLLITRVFFHRAVPWTTYGAGYELLAVSTFPKRTLVSSFVGCRIGAKESLYQCLMDLADARPSSNVLDWFSPSFVWKQLPSEDAMEEQRREFFRFHQQHSPPGEEDRRWFVKPGGYVVGGKGIQIFTEPSDMLGYAGTLLKNKGNDKEMQLAHNERPAVVVQKKIPNLFRFEGRLCDMRVLVIVTSIKPREAYWMPMETLFRTTGSSKESTDSTSRKDLLVNFSFHKNPNYVLMVEEMREYLEKMPHPRGSAHGTGWDAWMEDTVPAITKGLSSVFSLPLEWEHRDRAFQMLGCDFMMDATTFLPTFIECNDGPMYFGAYIPRLKPMFMERLYPQALDLVANTGRNCPDLLDRNHGVVKLDTSNPLSDAELMRARHSRRHSDW